ncbi:MAG: hypothetical protein JW969_13730 [Spirochaetales bacterium]|nr:hypothetical protein [Spirochaetales bacterium]
MPKVYTLMSTGISELDNVINGVMPGDNIVWQVDNIDDYLKFVDPYCTDAVKNGNTLIYFRFADHKELVPDNIGAKIYHLHPEIGFESFIADIFKVIEEVGEGAFYVFDCLSELAVDWYSDRMLANFFMLTCPYLYDYDTVTYFALMRNYNTSQTVNAIHETAQVIIDVYNRESGMYIHPLKVYKRYSKTMYMLHQWQEKKFVPVGRSIHISEILHDLPHLWLNTSNAKLDMWNRVFERAQELITETSTEEDILKEKEECRQRMLRMVVTRDERLLKLADKYFTLKDLVEIGNHMIGTGLIGGKTVGMLLARAILENKDPSWKKRLETHDSFYIGSDVFYTYLIKSKCWWVRWKQKHSENFLEGVDEARKRLISGTFPTDIKNQMKEILNYFGQSPIIVRSSSLLEDAYGNSFSGKYESVFCTNQGNPEERFEEFMNAVKTVYASTMSREALQYRHQRGLLDRDEQMALLIQRVSGSIYKDYFYPQTAGVGYSYNLYVWDKNIDPKAGVIRLVFGLGTRAVDRHDDDYTRVVSVNEPNKRPEANFEEVKKFAQKKADVLNLEKNRMESAYFSDIADHSGLPLEILASRDAELERYAKENNKSDIFPWILTFEGLLSKTKFIEDIKSMLATLQDAYEHAVDIEFTANFLSGEDYRINLLQCRPFQVKKGVGAVKDPGNINAKNILLKTTGPIIGNSSHFTIDRLVYVVPEVYGKMSERERYETARLIGKITNLGKKKKTIMLLGPGRWGTTTPSLGVPVHFGEINRVSVLCETAEMHEGLIPDVSFGTHFFNDLVELDIHYLAIQPTRKDNVINKALLDQLPNNLENLLQVNSKWNQVVKVMDFMNGNTKLYLYLNAVEQRGLCYVE